jgi:F0F1-type ATP synthase membrane subunit c/vacuolar-type H+-ATPase subunit K
LATVTGLINYTIIISLVVAMLINWYNRFL